MTKQKQKQFVRELINNIHADVRAKFDAGKIPEEWDGHELRQLLAVKFTESARMSECMRDARGKRRRDFDNEVIVRNL